jgi:hypothetical protein
MCVYLYLYIDTHTYIHIYGEREKQTQSDRQYLTYIAQAGLGFMIILPQPPEC